MSETQTEEPVCHCGLPLHFTDPMVEDYFKDLVRVLGPTVKVQAMGKTWEVQRYYIALHGLKAAELPDLGFPEVEPPATENKVALVPGSPFEPVDGLTLAPGESLEAAPGPLEGDESDEALLMYQEASEALRPRQDPSEVLPPKSPMRSVVTGKHARLSAALNETQDAKMVTDPLDRIYDLVVAIAEFLLDS